MKIYMYFHLEDSFWKVHRPQLQNMCFEMKVGINQLILLYITYFMFIVQYML